MELGDEGGARVEEGETAVERRINLKNKIK